MKSYRWMLVKTAYIFGIFAICAFAGCGSKPKESAEIAKPDVTPPKPNPALNTKEGIEGLIGLGKHTDPVTPSSLVLTKDAIVGTWQEDTFSRVTFNSNGKVLSRVDEDPKQKKGKDNQKMILNGTWTSSGNKITINWKSVEAKEISPDDLRDTLATPEILDVTEINDKHMTIADKQEGKITLKKVLLPKPAANPF